MIGILQRDGELRIKVVPDAKGATVKGMVRENVAPGSTLMTDEAQAYKGLARDYHHHSVNHSAGEYVRDFYIHTNGIESVWALVKRQIIGVHHWISPKHLSRYLEEIAWRFNRRDDKDASRLNDLLACTEGRRLTYKALIA